MDALREYIKSSPLVQAAITEAVHRFYFERIGKENAGIGYLVNALEFTARLEDSS